MKSLLEDIDFLSKQESLRINSQKRYKNLLGGILSVFIVLLSIIMIVYFIIEALSNNDPRVIESKIINKLPKNYSLDKNEIEFFVSMEFSNSTYYRDETIYQVNAILSEINFVSINGTISQISHQKKIRMIKCSDYYTAKEILQFNVNFPYKLFYCFPPNIAYFGGFWASPYFSSLKISIDKCNNNTIKDTDLPCKPTDEINHIINNGIISLMITDYLIDHKNFSFPLTKYLKNIFDRLSDKNSINYLITYSNLVYKTDLGWIFNDYDIKNVPIIGELKNSYNFVEQDTIAFYQIQTNYFEFISIKSYVKIQDLLTKIGGVTKSLVLMGMMLNYLYSYSFDTIDNVLVNHINSINFNNQKYSNIYTIKNLKPESCSSNKLITFNKLNKNALFKDCDILNNSHKFFNINYNFSDINNKLSETYKLKNIDNKDLNSNALSLRKLELGQNSDHRNGSNILNNHHQKTNNNLIRLHDINDNSNNVENNINNIDNKLHKNNNENKYNKNFETFKKFSKSKMNSDENPNVSNNDNRNNLEKYSPNLHKQTVSNSVLKPNQNNISSFNNNISTNEDKNQIVSNQIKTVIGSNKLTYYHDTNRNINLKENPSTFLGIPSGRGNINNIINFKVQTKNINNLNIMKNPENNNNLIDILNSNNKEINHDYSTKKDKTNNNNQNSSAKMIFHFNKSKNYRNTRKYRSKKYFYLFIYYINI